MEEKGDENHWFVWERAWVPQIVEEIAKYWTIIKQQQIKKKTKMELVVNFWIYSDMTLPEYSIPGLNISSTGQARLFMQDNSQYIVPSDTEMDLLVRITMHPKWWEQEFSRGCYEWLDHFQLEILRSVCRAFPDDFLDDDAFGVCHERVSDTASMKWIQFNMFAQSHLVAFVLYLRRHRVYKHNIQPLPTEEEVFQQEEEEVPQLHPLPHERRRHNQKNSSFCLIQ
jgi:hypothetical protein